MNLQAGLWQDDPEPQGRRPGETIQEAFESFHRANPAVYRELCALMRLAKSRGRKRIGIAMLYEVLRWNYFLRTAGEDFKLNNNFQSRYARLIEKQEPDLRGMFEFRELHTE